ncbi:MAG TPA: DUF4124 domain-containing protein [Burkholderiales bacterium]|nr:DUF4124 domain-containing protein [Burkholderiales bacterium]
MILRALILVLFAAVPLAAGAQTYRCVGKDGKKYYGQSLPRACIGQPAEILNAEGRVIKKIDPQASETERAAQEKEEAERKKREAIAKEEGRRNRALLATYTSAQDIEGARGRALKENDAAVKDIQNRIASLKKHQAELEKEAAAKDSKTPPAQIQSDLKTVEFDLKTQHDALAAKQKEVEAINARYDEDKKRYLELTQGGKK